MYLASAKLFVLFTQISPKNMKIVSNLLSLIFLIAILSACGKGKSINYKEKLEGVWQLNNAADILKSGDAPPYSAEQLRNSTITFLAGGKLQTSVGNDNGEGTWDVAHNGSSITLVANNVRFGEELPLNFENERTIVITNTGKKFVFKKISD